MKKVIKDTLTKAPLEALKAVESPSKERPDMSLTPDKIKKVVEMLGAPHLYGGAPGIAMLANVERSAVVEIQKAALKELKDRPPAKTETKKPKTTKKKTAKKSPSKRTAKTEPKKTAKKTTRKRTTKKSSTS